MVAAVISHTDRLKLGVQLYHTGISFRLAAEQSGTTPALLYQHLRFTNQVRKSGRNWQRQVDPDEATILARAEEIRAGWTPEEASRRWVGKTHGRVIEIRNDRRRGRVA